MLALLLAAMFIQGAVTCSELNKMVECLIMCTLHACKSVCIVMKPSWFIACWLIQFVAVT